MNNTLDFFLGVEFSALSLYCACAVFYAHVYTIKRTRLSRDIETIDDDTARVIAAIARAIYLLN